MSLPVTNGLVAHFDANSIAGLSNNDKIQQWDDLSGNNYHLTQVTESRRPEYHTNVMFNRPCVYFSSNGWMGTPTWTDIAPPFTAFLVHSSVTPSNGVSWDTNGGARSFMARDKSGAWRIWNASDFTNSSSVGVTTNILLITATWGNPGKLRFNKGNEVTGNTGNNGIGSLRIASDNGGSRNLTGYYGEIILFNRDMTQQEIDAIEDYLWNKWFVEPTTDIKGPFPTFYR